MFENLNPSKNPDDIFAEVDKTPVASAPIQSPTPISAPNPVMPTQPTMADMGLNPTPAHNGGKAIKKVFVMVLIVLILGVIAYAAYLFLVNKKAPANINENPIVNQTDNNIEVPEVTIIDENLTAATNTMATDTPIAATNTIPAPAVLDYDQDGLSDDEERILGTDPLNIDADKDGLSDYDEVKIYKTNPLLIDTDGDSYADGDEVKAGYNPNGSGKL